MASNPFFSGRIPQALHDKAEEYCQQTGKKKTDLLVEALSVFLNFPIQLQRHSVAVESSVVTREMFDLLQERVLALETLANPLGTNIITNDNTSDNDTHLSDNAIYQSDNNVVSKDYPKVKVDLTQIVVDSDPIDNTTDNKKLEESSESIDQSTIISYDNSGDNKQQSDFEHKLKAITDTKLIELSNRSKKQILGLRGAKVREFKKGGIELRPGQMLEKPVAASIKDPIIVNGNIYTLYFLGIDLNGEGLWNLIPNDSSS